MLARQKQAVLKLTERMKTHKEAAKLRWREYLAKENKQDQKRTSTKRMTAPAPYYPPREFLTIPTTKTIAISPVPKGLRPEIFLDLCRPYGSIIGYDVKLEHTYNTIRVEMARPDEAAQAVYSFNQVKSKPSFTMILSDEQIPSVLAPPNAKSGQVFQSPPSNVVNGESQPKENIPDPLKRQSIFLIPPPASTLYIEGDLEHTDLVPNHIQHGQEERPPYVAGETEIDIPEENPVPNLVHSPDSDDSDDVAHWESDCSSNSEDGSGIPGPCLGFIETLELDSEVYNPILIHQVIIIFIFCLVTNSIFLPF